MTLVRFIGDVHGKFTRYKRTIRSVDRSIQVGDMGVGFKRYDPYTDSIVNTENPPYDTMVESNARFIRGNHDNPEECKKHSQWIKDGHTETIGDHKVMFIGGAWSIDYEYRTPGISWWEDEQCSQAYLNFLIGEYETYRPDVMVTHDCPTQISNTLHLDAHKPRITTRTDQALQAMFEIHQPKIHLYGHWHQDRDQVINGTRFICLGELSYIDLEL